MEFQQGRGFMRPPQPADPYQRPPPNMPPPPGNQQWHYPPAQFQFQPVAHNSASPPPPQWPPPHSSGTALYPSHPPLRPPPPYPAHLQMPYPAQHPHSSQPPYPQQHQFPPRPSQAPPHSYAQNNNEEDWAAKARAWAAAKAATDNQLPLSHSTPNGRNDLQNNFHGQFPQPLDPQYHEMHNPLGSTLNYQQYPAATGPQTWTAQGQLLDSQISSSSESAYASDAHAPFSSADGKSARDSMTQTLQTKASITPFVHPQEVPSSYSSLAGANAAQERTEKVVASHPQLSTNGRLGWVEESPQVPGGLLDSVPDQSNQLLNFAPYFNHGRETSRLPSHSHSGGVHTNVADPNLAMTPNFAWTPSSTAGPVYPPVPPIPSGPQHDPTAMPPPASGHLGPIFPPGPGFQPTVPIGAAFGISSAVVPHPASFSGDTYGISERPKKASVPNWLREEIIKNRTALASSAPDIQKDDSQSVEEDINDTYFSKRAQADSRSIDSAKSMEDDEEDEDEMEAARSAAINQEIKRILTEVLLKVTDELFDEIATKVLREDGISSEGRQDIDSDASKIQNLESTPSLTANASTKVLLPAKNIDGDYEEVREKSDSGSHGDLLGLASYASDEEEENTQSSIQLNQPALSSDKILESSRNIENCSLSEANDKGTNLAGFETDDAKTGWKSGNPRSKDFDNSATSYLPSSSGRLSDVEAYDSENASGISKLKNSSIRKSVERTEEPDDTSQLKHNSNRSDESDGCETIKHLSKQEQRDPERSKEVMDGNEEKEVASHEKRRQTNGRVNYDSDSKEKGRMDVMKKSGSKSEASPFRGKEGRIDIRSESRNSLRDGEVEKQQVKSMDEKKERVRIRSATETIRHGQRQSSVVSARGREGKDDSSDESSGYSKRKLHHSRRNKSPSPVRSRKRQVLPSAHSRHSKRRHSPYSSMEISRRRKSPSRSRSRSPAHRR